MSIRNVLRASLVLIGVMCTVVTGAVRAEPRITAPLTVSGEGPWYRAVLPLAWRWHAGHADLRDLRVVNAAGEMLPFSIVWAREQAERTERDTVAAIYPLIQPARVGKDIPGLRIERRSDGTVVDIAAAPNAPKGNLTHGWLIDVSNAPGRLLSLHLALDGGEGFQAVRIEASDDLQSWTLLGGGQVGGLTFQGNRLANDTLALPGNRARYLRLWWETPERAPRLDAAQVRSTVSQLEPVRLDWSDPLVPVRENGSLRVDLPGALRVSQVRFSLPDGNVLTQANIEAAPPAQARGKPSWRTVGQADLYRLSVDGQPVTQDVVSLPEVWISQLRVHDRAGVFATWTPSVSVATPRAEIVFLPRGEAPYAVAFGPLDAASPAIPLASLMPQAEADRFERLAVATVDVSQLRVAAAATDSNWRKLTLWGVLIAGVALLAWLAIGLLRGQRRPE